MPAQEIGVGKGTKLAAVHKGFEFGLDGPVIVGRDLARGNGGGHAGRFGRVRLQGIGHIHKVQGVQGIEMHQVVMQELHAQHQVAQIGGVSRNRLVDGVFQGAGRGQGVRIGTDAAGALGKMLGVARVAAFENEFQATEQGAAAAGFLDLALFHFHFNTQMPLNTGQRIHHHRAGVIALGRFDDFTHNFPPSSGRTASFRPRSRARCNRCRDARRPPASWSD